MDVVEMEGTGTYKFRVETDEEDPSISYVLTQPADDMGYGGPVRRLKERRLDGGYSPYYSAAVAKNTLHRVEDEPTRNLEACGSSPCTCFTCNFLCTED